MPAKLTTAETLAELGICRATLFKRIKQGYIRPLPTNPLLEHPYRIYFAREEVERAKREGLRKAS